MNMFSIKNLFIQLIGFIGTFFYFSSYQFKENKKLYRFQFISYIFYVLHFFLLGAITGAISYIINLISSYCLSSNNKKLHSNKMCIILCLSLIVVGCFTWNGIITLLPIIANIAAIIGGYTHNAKKIRFVGIFINSPLWIIHNAIVGSWSGVIDELICEGSMIISVIRYGWNNLDKEEPHE